MAFGSHALAFVCLRIYLIVMLGLIVLKFVKVFSGPGGTSPLDGRSRAPSAPTKDGR